MDERARFRRAVANLHAAFEGRDRAFGGVLVSRMNERNSITHSDRRANRAERGKADAEINGIGRFAAAAAQIDNRQAHIARIHGYNEA